MGRIVDLREWDMNTPDIDHDIVASLNRDLQRGLVCEVVIQPPSSVGKWQAHKLVSATLQPENFHETETFDDALSILASKNLDTAL